MRLADGTLAGSTLTMDQALRNLASIGLPIADVVVSDRELTLVTTYVEGEAVVDDA